MIFKRVSSFICLFVCLFFQDQNESGFPPRASRRNTTDAQNGDFPVWFPIFMNEGGGRVGLRHVPLPTTRG